MNLSKFYPSMFSINLLVLFMFFAGESNAATKKRKRIQYKTVFGQCPSKVAGTLTLKLMKEFEKRHSLLDLKKMILKDKLEEKHFLSSYKIDYSPVEDLIKFNFDCPKPLLKAQIYKESGEEFFTAILVEGAKFVDPTYEVLLRAEKKIDSELAHLAFPVKLINTDIVEDLEELVLAFNNEYQGKISEIIVDESKKLTLIFGLSAGPTSVFLGENYWSEKVSKLIRIMSYMKKKKTVPAVINLTNSKKVVVKFSDTI